MKVKQFLLLIVAGIMVLSVCGGMRCIRKKTYQEERSLLLTENAKVLYLLSITPMHGKPSIINPSTDNGEMSTCFVPVNVDVPNVYAIILKCEHGEFIFKSPKIKQLWEGLKEGQEVIVTYREVYKNKYNSYKLKESRLIKYEFIDVKPK
ncbi:MAG: hypothetical protein UT90_C0005G0010 [Parcubacteria group bacterium GW2011_GWA1_40_21]|nr:MAG: hypothetical protein UT80_C0052G0012 [Parcubacteria group bacterium GW2011_GWC1_40_13]KKR53703.1 MAG: hypothetical protein UT90_C0005G0010 [Parcubacteria group bacterium GW2011_GWA1_40_21]